VIGVVVGVDDMRDPEMLGLGDLQVGRDVPPGVDDDGLAGVSQEIGGAAKVVIEDLTKEHDGPFSCFS
jgi:hypothetical protein